MRAALRAHRNGAAMLACDSFTEASAALLATHSLKRAQRCLPLVSSRRSAREAAQPIARKYVELTDFGTIRSRSAMEAQTYEN
jgi:hypothetical protein